MHPLQQEADQAVRQIAEAARRFLRVYDEFWPEEPGAIDPWLQGLVEAVDNLEPEADQAERRKRERFLMKFADLLDAEKVHADGKVHIPAAIAGEVADALRGERLGPDAEGLGIL